MTAKHYLQTTGDHFEHAAEVSSGKAELAEETDRSVLQNPVQYVAESSGTAALGAARPKEKPRETAISPGKTKQIDGRYRIRTCDLFRVKEAL